MMLDDLTITRIPPAVLGIREVATLTGLSRSTILRLMAMQEFAPRLRLSAKRYGFKIADIEQWLDERRERA